jgi:hypothetical protein
VQPAALIKVKRSRTTRITPQKETPWTAEPF